MKRSLFSAADLTGLTNYLQERDSNGGIPNSDLIRNIRVDGEFLSSAPLSLYDTIGTANQVLSHGPYSDPSLDMHSIALLTVFLLSEKSSPASNLSEVTKKLTNLLEMFFDEKLYERTTDSSNTTEPNLLEHLIRNQVGLDPVAANDENVMLDRFTADMWSIAQEGGLTMADTNLTQALIAFAMQAYYDNKLDPDATLFQSIPGGLRFDRTNIADTLDQIKGYQNDPGGTKYFQDFLSTLPQQVQTQITSHLPHLTDWFIQAGMGGMGAMANDKSAFMLGGTGSDYLTGSSQADLLVGLTGNDVLIGGQGDDVLMGGKGFDTYILNPGDGNDRIIEEREADGRILGVIKEGTGNIIGTGAWQDLGSGLYENVETGEQATHNSPFTLQHNGGQITLENFQSGDFGITLLDKTNPAQVIVGPGDDDDNYLLDHDDPLDVGRKVQGGGGRDMISGATGDDFLYGGDGDDWINGVGGADRIEAGAGNDLITWIGGGSMVKGGNGADIISANARFQLAVDIPASPFTDDVIWADMSQHWQAWHADTFSIDGSGYLAVNYSDGFPVNGTFSGASKMGGGWTYEYTITNTVLEMKYFHPTEAPGGKVPAWDIRHGMAQEPMSDKGVVLLGEGGDDVLIGHNQSDYLSGGTQKDILIGNGGNDILDGGAGDDALAGGDGGDTILGGEGSDQLFGESGSDVLYGEAGNDIIWADSQSSQLASQDGDDYADGGSGDDQIVGQGGNDTLRGGVGDDVVFGDNGDDSGIGGADMLYGDAGNDTLYGEAGDDIIFGGTDNDELSGEDGNDMLSGDDGQDKLYGGAGSDTLLGGQGIDTLVGGSGNDILDGGAGADILVGGSGSDTYIIDNPGDTISNEALNGEEDLVQSSISYTLDGNLENLTLTGGDNLSATGNDLDNVLTGNSGDNILNGGSGDDLLIGGAGADTMIGGSGMNTYVVDNVNDIAIAPTNDNAGWNGVLSSVSYTLGTNIDVMGLTGTADINGTGNELNNHITGNAGSNTLRGEGGDDYLSGSYSDESEGSGEGEGEEGGEYSSGFGGSSQAQISGAESGQIDTLIGGMGNDTYDITDRYDAIIELSGEGTDWVQSSLIYTLGENLENLRLQGDFDINGTGNDLDNTIIGNHHNNILDGGKGNDHLEGYDGNDTYLFGRGDGQDRIEKEYYSNSNWLNIIQFKAGVSSNDILFNKISDQDSAALELSVIGTTDKIIINSFFNLDGTVHSNTPVQQVKFADGTIWDIPTLIDKANDEGVINGGTGNDVLYGTAGNDKINGGAGNDYLSAKAGDDTLYGGAGNDKLIGGVGADTLIGGAGNDTYYLDNTGDVVTEEADQGTDTVRSSVTHTLGVNVENLILTGTESINATGNTQNNALYGNSGVNVLSGGAGNDYLSAKAGDDTLYGGAGNDKLIGGVGADTLVGGIGNDTYVYNPGSGADLIDNSDGGTDRLIFTGDITSDRLTYHASGDNLQIRIDNSDSAMVTVSNWFNSSEHQLAYIQAAGGSGISASQIDALLEPVPEVSLVQTTYALEMTASNKYFSGHGPENENSWGELGDQIILHGVMATDPVFAAGQEVSV